MKKDIYSTITNKILESLKNGTILWRKSWKLFYPHNFVSKRQYHGINFILLSMLDFKSPYFLTFNQAQKLGGQILKDSEGQEIVFWKILNGVKENKKGELKGTHVPLLKFSYVFNLTQTDLYKEEEPIILEERPNAEDFLKSLSFVPEIRHDKNRAYYSPTFDFISIPPKTDFFEIDEYYATLFHEIIHSTGNSSRLNRFTPGAYKGDENYSFEELVAELGSAFLCSMCGIDNTLQNSAAYIKGWSNIFQNDEKIIIKASTQAKNAINFLLNISVNKAEDIAA